MKVIVATHTGGKYDRIASSLARALTFTLFDVKRYRTRKVGTFVNPCISWPNEVNETDVQTIIHFGAEAVIAGTLDDTVAENFEKAGVQMFLAYGMQAVDAVHCYIRGELPEFHLALPLEKAA